MNFGKAIENLKNGYKVARKRLERKRNASCTDPWKIFA